MTKNLFSLAEAAVELGVTPDTLRQQANTGRLRASKVGAMWVVSGAELQRYRRDNLGKVGPKPRKPNKGR